MTWTVIVIIAVVVVLALVFMLKGGSQPAQLPQAPEEPKKLPKAEDKKLVPEKKKAEPEREGRKPDPKAAETTAPKQGQAPTSAKADVAEPPGEQPGAEPVQVGVAAEQKPNEHVGAPVVGRTMEPTAVAARARDVEGLRKGLGRSRGAEGFFGKLAKLITGDKEIEPSIADDLEEVLITSDVGVATTEAMLARIRDGLNKKELASAPKVWDALRADAKRILSLGEGGLTLRTKPTVVLMVGVNGSGKTTTIGKMATQLTARGRKVVLAAGDTFRAAAVQQLEVWGKRVGCDVVKGKDGADPGAVIFDAIKRAADMGADVVLADTAGRLHTKTPLMDELKKVIRTMGKAMDGAPHEIFLVIDATNGQNAVAQSRMFAEAFSLSGIVLTKLDGTAKGGVILGICDELKVPVRYIGIGERADDLRPFDADEFVEALLG
ncbi:MAG: signal recognition particle-docking protein FtsY, partial [Polyangiaceae bacterium]|nr:signal recognition particle-docking protein FtsY [Polyangiaceae bacterium]